MIHALDTSSLVVAFERTLDLAQVERHEVTQASASLREHALGRKRLLDTLLAATYFTNDIRSVVTTNQRDFLVFGHLSVLKP